MTHLDAKREISPDDIDAALKRPSDFGYSGARKDEMFHTWSLGPIILQRDSGLLAQSNRDALVKHLESDPTLADDWELTSCNHWAVGWVEHISFRVVEVDGTPTRMFRVVKEWFDALESYPVADDHDYSEREYLATLKNIEDAARNLVSDSAPDGWASEVYRWLADDPRSWFRNQLENRDDQGGYPSEDALKEALAHLDWLACDDTCADMCTNDECDCDCHKYGPMPA